MTARRDRRLVDITAGILGFVVPAISVYAVLKQVWPTQHDLSDIGTGLMRDLLAFVAGLVGAVVAVALARRWRG